MNRIVAENQRPGSPSTDWDTNGTDDGSIEGFATQISVNVGDEVTFKVRTVASAYRVDVYRLGYYGGLGARKVATVFPSLPLQAQPEGIFDEATGLLDCSNWSPSATWTALPSDPSGVYLGKLVREDGGAGTGHIVFVVRDDAREADLMFQTADTTWQAYNDWGGKSLYDDYPAPPRARKVSYNRPFRTRAVESGANWLFNGEYAMLRWLEANGYDLTYCAAADLERSNVLDRHRVFLSVGHDEYWSPGQRQAVTAARDRGMHLAFFSGNSVFWKTRWEQDAENRPFRTLVCYKDGAVREDPIAWTGLWRDGRVALLSGGAFPEGVAPENALTGVLTGTLGFTDNAIAVPSDYGRLRFWRHTTAAAQPAGGLERMTAGTLGYEWDQDKDNRHRPAGLMHLSSSTVPVKGIILDNDLNYEPGEATHHATLYRHSSGALVFSAATVQWSWGLDAYHDTPPSVNAGPPDDCIGQATVNLLADMGVQPETLQPPFVATTASVDFTPPTSTIVTPADGETLASGMPAATLNPLITGTAADVGGVVAGVEVSVDGGVTWSPADGTTSWKYRWVPQGNGIVTLLSRAVDDSGNLQPASRVKVTVGERVDPGPGGPVLVVVNGSYAGNRFGGYLVEILRAEGLHAFSAMELVDVMDAADSLALLESYAVVILAETPLLPEQEALLRAYVSNGSALIAMRPPRALAQQFGLSFERTAYENSGVPQFLQFTPGSPAASGLTPLSLQFHGSADLYSLQDTVALASLCTDLSTPSPYPAVARSGNVVVFTFDLPASIVLMRQGNPDWRDSEGDGVGTGEPGLLLETAAYRAMDMFTRTDGRLWYEPERLQVPQADELQRFFAHIVMDLVGRPLPRLWYLPDAHKWLIANTGDSCASTPAKHDAAITVVNRFGTMGVYLTHGDIAGNENNDERLLKHQEWRAAGNDIGIHAHDSTGHQTVESLTKAFGDTAEKFAARYGRPARAARNHTGEWTGWAEMAEIESSSGTQLDLNYYHYFNFRAHEKYSDIRTPRGKDNALGYCTGSGLPQRFCNHDGRILPIYQILTEWADEFFHDNSVDAGVAGGFTVEDVVAEVRAMIDRAEQGFYSAFVMQTHPARLIWWDTGLPDPPSPRPPNKDFVSEWAPAIWSHAQSRGVPLISPEQLLDFVQARAGATFADMTWNGETLSFDLAAPTAGQALTVMLPAERLESVQVDGVNAEPLRERLMGRDYALIVTTALRARITARYSGA